MGRKPKALVHKDGSVDFVNPETGEIEASAAPKTTGVDGRNLVHDRERSDYDFRWKTATDGNHILVPRDVPQKNLDPEWSIWKNKRNLCLEIAMEIANGKTFYQLDKLKQFPSTRTVFYWYARDQEFKNLIDEARRVRAEFYHDKLVEVAEEVDEDNARSSKVKADIMKHLMGVNDRERFGQQVKQDPAPATVNIVFQTGIQREPIPVEGTVVNVEPSEND
jgi:hypothetical protein